MNLFELFVKIGVDDQASKHISNISGKLGNGLKTAAKVGTAAVATVTAAAGTMTAAFVKGTSEVAQYGDNIDKMSQKMGLSAEAYQEWDFIMQHSGTSMEALKAGMKTLANAVDSGNDAFERLGITQNEIASMNQEELFAKTIEQLQKVDNETERTYLAGQLLGRGATELGALLNTSAEDTEAMRQQVHELGGVMSNEAVKAAAAYQDSLQNMQTAFSGIQRGMLSEFLPSMVTVMDGLALIFSGNDSGIAKITEGVNQFADKLMEAVPKIFELGDGILSSLVTAILDNLPTLNSTATSIIIKLVDGIVSALPVLVESGLDLIVSLATGIAESLPELIPTIVDVVLQIVNTLTNPETLASLVDASIAIIMGLADGLITALPMLIDQLPIIIDNIIVAITENLPKIIEMGIELVIKLAAGLIQAIPQLVSKIPQIITSLVNGFVSYYSKIFQIGKDLVSKVGEGFKNMLQNAKNWGKDLLDNFIGGIKAKIQKLKDTVAGVAQKVKDFLGFSEPKKGPLSNFHTYAPDMMDLFAKGIRDNEDVITDQIEKSFDFGERTIKFGAEYGNGYDSVSATRLNGGYGGTSFGDIIINIDGAKYSDEQSLASAIALEIQNMTDRRAAVYA